MKISLLRSNLLRNYMVDSESEIERISADVSKLFEQMLQFAHGNPAASEWLDFTQACLKKMGNINDSQNF